MEQKLFVKPAVENVIPLATARKWTSSWRKWAADQGVQPDEILKGFMVPFSDIKNLANFPVEGVSGVRIYLALDVEDDIKSIKVILVPVDKDKKDILAYPKVEGEDDDEDSAIFDLTMPCPEFCDVDSPLGK